MGFGNICVHPRLSAVPTASLPRRRMSLSPMLASPEDRTALAAQYRDALLGDVIPFWLRHGMDAEHGGILTALDRDGTVTDTDKPVWFQGRAAWMFATLFNTAERRPEWLDAARSCIEFSRRHCFA